MSYASLLHATGFLGGDVDLTSIQRLDRSVAVHFVRDVLEIHQLLLSDGLHLLEDYPRHGLVAGRGGQAARVGVVLGVKVGRQEGLQVESFSGFRHLGILVNLWQATNEGSQWVVVRLVIQPVENSQHQ